MKVLISLTLAFICLHLNAQEKAKYYAIESKRIWLDKSGNYTFDEDWKAGNTLILWDKNNGRVEIYGIKHHVLDIPEKLDGYKDDLGDWLVYQGVDESGIKCGLRVLVLNKPQAVAGYLYIDYSDQCYAYKLKNPHLKN